jgi:hypothetical protein
MSYVVAAPGFLNSAATDLAGIRSALSGPRRGRRVIPRNAMPRDEQSIATLSWL